MGERKRQLREVELSRARVDRVVDTAEQMRSAGKVLANQMGK